MSNILTRIIQITAVLLLWLLLYFNLDEMTFDLVGYRGGQITPSGQKALNIEEKIMFEELLLFRPYWYKVADDLTGERRYVVRTYIELFKDVGLVLIALAGVLRCLALKRIHKGVIFFAPLFLLAFYSASLNFFRHEDVNLSKNFLISGTRWLLAVTTALCLIGNVDDRTMRLFCKALVMVFLMHFWLQIIELFFSQNIFGVGFFDLASRVRGLINLPTPAGAFACFAGFYAYFQLPSSRLRSFVVVASFISALLSGAGAAIFVWFAAIFIMSFKGRFLWVKLIVLPALAVPMFYNLGRITGRGNTIYDSVYIRYENYVRTFLNVKWIEPNFGIATNTAQLLVDTLARIPDSTYVSFAFNLGLLGVFSLLFIFAVILVLGYRWHSNAALIFTIIFMVFGFGMNLTESFPNNLIIAIWIGYFFTHHTQNSPEWWFQWGAKSPSPAPILQN